MKEIEKYMFLMEAALRHDISYETLKNKVKPSLANQKQLEDMIERGIVRYFEPPRDPNKSYQRIQRSWLVTDEAVREWFPNQKKKDW
ncbi:hypothetical protein COE15_12880 [Bacillus cereus]|uniref:hypothetical protein n=1 Tax=Bacillus TaxID=1386 RepID=UPI000BF004DB|nr:MULTISPECIES: hypothetical protein [Bacillus]PEM68535.1 hypothetical protein CN619_23270 [Bacillus pseudomycoides]PFD95599.1 hypothetical protein CN288_26530 [Bacillus sp. AFS023182]PGY00659.1 hypothetical protein COE15_12880 [Bacillus cereus]